MLVFTQKALEDVIPAQAGIQALGLDHIGGLRYALSPPYNFGGGIILPNAPLAMRLQKIPHLDPLPEEEGIITFFVFFPGRCPGLSSCAPVALEKPSRVF